MTDLRLGPVLRYVGGDGGGEATVWLEASAPCTAEVRCTDGAFGEAETFTVEGHHYALVTVSGLTPGTVTAYEVRLDGRTVWPDGGGDFPPSSIRTPAAGTDEVRVAFGSCRWAAPAKDRPDPVGPDALDTLARELAGAPEEARPDVLLLLGDQVYADETSEETQRRLAGRRDLSKAPGTQVADYEEYTLLYDESWGDPEVRWLLSTVPTCMVFDDHDVIDDWNTSEAWLAEMRRTDWWQRRLRSGLMSYWVYQHLGNLSPADLASDKVFAAVRAASDGTALLAEFADAADRDPANARWSFSRDFGRTRLVVVDSRAARVLSEERRALVDPDEFRWVREQVMAGRGQDTPAPYDHLLIGTSLPWLLPPLIHAVEGWNAAMCAGERGGRWARFGERLRRRADLEHWPAFPRSFDELSGLIVEAGGGPGAPATISVLSGDVHHSYIAEASFDGTGAESLPVASTVAQLTCSPVHNSVPRYMKVTFRLGWGAPGRMLNRLLVRHGRLGRPPVAWSRTGGPWFGNHLMTLALRGRSAELRLDRARRDGGRACLVTVDERRLTPHGPAGAAIGRQRQAPGTTPADSGQGPFATDR